jgi:hypothetical protein
MHLFAVRHCKLVILHSNGKVLKLKILISLSEWQMGFTSLWEEACYWDPCWYLVCGISLAAWAVLVLRKLKIYHRGKYLVL